MSMTFIQNLFYQLSAAGGGIIDRRLSDISDRTGGGFNCRQQKVDRKDFG